MAVVQVLFSREGDDVPALDWLGRQDRRAQNKILTALELLREQGHDLRRPWSDTL